MTDLLIRGGRVLIPSRGFDGVSDVLIEKGKVRRIAPKIESAKGVKHLMSVDATGLWATAGLVDIHTHLREPGYEYKETIATGTRAAAAGGFSSIMCMANTNPVNDNAAVTRFILRKSQEVGAVKVYPVGAVTVGLKGENLSEMVDMAHNGCRAFSDDGKPVMNSFVLRKALEYLRYIGKPYISHAEESTLSSGGQCHEGDISFSLGLKGIPSAAEEVMVARDIILSRLTGGRVHFAHISTRGSLKLIEAAKEEGLPVTAEVTPHHLFLTDEAVRAFDTNTKVNPPLREEEDRQALIKALFSGVIDCIASDHAPHGIVDKEIEYDFAASGISGLETSLPICMRLVHDHGVSPLRLMEMMSYNPANAMDLPEGDLREGGPADITLIDPALDYTVKPEEFLSKGKNTPFAGWNLKGKAVMTIVDGKIVYRHPTVDSRLAKVAK